MVLCFSRCKYYKSIAIIAEAFSVSVLPASTPVGWIRAAAYYLRASFNGQPARDVSSQIWGEALGQTQGHRSEVRGAEVGGEKVGRVGRE